MTLLAHVDGLSQSKQPVVETFNKWLETLSETCSDIFVSFDIDAIIGKSLDASMTRVYCC